jgi:hypothetical protein
MLSLLIWWYALFGACLFIACSGSHRGALLLAYFVGLSLIHVPGAINHLSNENGLSNFGLTYVGFRATLVGLTALLIGAAIGVRTGGRPKAPVRRADYGRAGRQLSVVGLLGLFVVLPVAAFVPSVTAIISGLPSVLIVGLLMIALQAIVTHDTMRLAAIILALPLLPLFTLASGGFLGFGLYWMISVLSFVVVHRRFAWLAFLALPAAGLIGLSVGVAYFGERTAIRNSVWIQQEGYSQRVEKITRIFTTFEVYDPGNPRHAAVIDERLNQNEFVGRGILLLQEGVVPYLEGSSLPWWALVPRAIWPDKPAVGGGGELVTRLTGITFAEGTSVGVGQVLEFFANFGWAGLILGFGILGFAFARLDRAVVDGLREANLQKVLNAALPGLALLQPGGNLLEILVATVSSAVLARLIGKLPVSFGKSPLRPVKASAGSL